MWQERADYGHFFYRIPNGESAADAYDRVSGFNESLWRQFGEDDCASVCVLGLFPISQLDLIRAMYSCLGSDSSNSKKLPTDLCPASSL
jgi:broad specificity phosphatase PhoE